MDDKRNDALLTNKEIVDSHLSLIRTCVSHQFRKAGKEDWDNREDFFQDLIIILYTYDNAKLNDALSKGEGMLNALITKIIINNLWSKTSKYYREYKQFRDKTDDIYLKIEEEDGDGDDEP